MSVQAFSPCRYAIVEQVMIDRVEEDKVGFFTRADGEGDDDRLRRHFTAKLVDILADAPDQAPPAVELRAGAVGNLYLSKEGWKIRSDDQERRPIYGAERPGFVTFKWPQCAAAPLRFISNLRVIAERIVVRGVAAGTPGRVVEIDLFGPDAAVTQRIDWNGAQDLAIQLTDRGATQLGLPRSVTLWPTRIVVSGRPASNPSVSGQVDLLDGALAAIAQTIAWSDRPTELLVRLTQAGFARFHVVPNAIRQISRGHLFHGAKELVHAWREIDVQELEGADREIFALALSRCAS